MSLSCIFIRKVSKNLSIDEDNLSKEPNSISAEDALTNILCPEIRSKAIPFKESPPVVPIIKSLSFTFWWV